jgi:hypothetical protein
MNRTLLLATVAAALACGIATSSAQAAPASGSLIGARPADALVQKARYDDYNRRGQWWWTPRRSDDDYRWRFWWWKKHHSKKHDDHRNWSWDDDGRRDHDRRGRWDK